MTWVSSSGKREFKEWRPVLIIFSFYKWDLHLALVFLHSRTLRACFHAYCESLWVVSVVSSALYATVLCVKLKPCCCRVLGLGWGCVLSLLGMCNGQHQNNEFSIPGTAVGDCYKNSSWSLFYNPSFEEWHGLCSLVVDHIGFRVGPRFKPPSCHVLAVSP